MIRLFRNTVLMGLAACALLLLGTGEKPQPQGIKTAMVATYAPAVPAPPDHKATPADPALSGLSIEEPADDQSKAPEADWREQIVSEPSDTRAHAKAYGLTEDIIAETETEDVYMYSEDEKKMIAGVVYAEARGEKQDGKVAVAQVVINRFESGRYGSTVRKVVYAKKQFAKSKKYDDACMQAVEIAIEERPHPENMFYFQVSRRKKWRNFVFHDRIGNHNFFCSKK